VKTAVQNSQALQEAYKQALAEEAAAYKQALAEEAAAYKQALEAEEVACKQAQALHYHQTS
jgi:hypothetical protein